MHRLWWVAAELEEALSILVHLPSAVVTQTGWPGAVVRTTNSGVEIVENEQRLLWRHIADDSGELIVDTCPLLLTGKVNVGA